MKRRVIVSIVVLVVIIFISGCGFNSQNVDPGLENGASGTIRANDHERGEGFGFWNQQRNKNNPIANVVTRDERPGRGMNGILDQKPALMNRRISRLEASDVDRKGLQNIKGFSNAQSSLNEETLIKQLSLEIRSMNSVRDVRIISNENKLLIAVDSETTDHRRLKKEINNVAAKYNQSKEVIVVSDRQAVDRIRLLEDGYIRQ